MFMNALTKWCRDEAPRWLGLSVVAVVGGWFVERLAVRLLVGSRSDRRELLLLVKRLKE
jgi:hypothetical protein